MMLDPRTTPVRDGLASQALEGVVRAERYVAPTLRVACVPAAAVLSGPDAAAEQVDQVLFGEGFEVLDEADGFAWGQARRDGYVGYVASRSLGGADGPATHRVSAIRAYAFTEPDLKSPAAGPFPLNALMTVMALNDRFALVQGAGWVPLAHLAPIGVFESEPVAVAERFVGVPYLWGGRDGLGLDCSGLVQQAFFACGRACPRDADQQAGLGTPIAQADLARGDLVAWPGHVALMVDDRRMIHASGWQAVTAIESLSEVVARNIAAGVGPPSGYRRT